LGLLVASVRVWRERSISTAGRVFFSLSVLVALLLIPWLNHWNLLGWRW
jgi:hypothetical protein